MRQISVHKVGSRRLARTNARNHVLNHAIDPRVSNARLDFDNGFARRNNSRTTFVQFFRQTSAATLDDPLLMVPTRRQQGLNGFRTRRWAFVSSAFPIDRISQPVELSTNALGKGRAACGALRVDGLNDLAAQFVDPHLFRRDKRHNGYAKLGG